MKRADLFASIAAALPIGALALVPDPPAKTELEPLKVPRGRDRWMIIHPSDGVSRLARHHEVGAPCSICIETGVPPQLL